LEAIFSAFFEWCASFKVTVVIAAGNAPERGLHNTVPQKLGTAENGIMTVGGVEKDGTLFQQTTMAQPEQAGSLTVYAPARDVIVPGPGEFIHDGTSQAAAIVVS
jgi:hypothetical protein